MNKATNEISLISSKKELSIIPGKKNTQIHNKQVNEMVAEAAYYRAEKRNFTEGSDLKDWLEAERAISKRVQRHGLSGMQRWNTDRENVTNH